MIIHFCFCLMQKGIAFDVAKDIVLDVAKVRKYYDMRNPTYMV